MFNLYIFNNNRPFKNEYFKHLNCTDIVKDFDIYVYVTMPIIPHK